MPRLLISPTPTVRSLTEAVVAGANDDALRHNLQADDADFYYRNGFTAHQAHVIKTNAYAEYNLWGGRSPDGLDAIVESHIPRGAVINMLLAADTPEHVDLYLRRYHHATDPILVAPTDTETCENIAAEAAMFKATQPHCCK